MTVVTAQGLTTAEAERRRAEQGPNRLPAPRRPSTLRRLVHFFALMLWVAGVLALLAGLPQLGVAIFAVIVINAVFAFMQESRADKAAERLRALLPTRVTVRAATAGRRRSTRSTSWAAIACWRKPVTASPPTPRRSCANGLLLDTSLLTGESVPATISVGDTMLAGTFVVEGTAEAVVTAVGSGDAASATIAQLTTATEKPKTPLTLGLAVVVRMIAFMALGVGGLFFGVSMLLGNSAKDGFVFAIGVTVALVPEALLPTVTLALAWGAEQMAKRNVLVRYARCGRDARVDDVHLHRQDRHADPQRDGRGSWMPAGRAVVHGGGYGPGAEVHSPSAAPRGRCTTSALSPCAARPGYAPGGRPLAAAR